MLVFALYKSPLNLLFCLDSQLSEVYLLYNLLKAKLARKVGLPCMIDNHLYFFVSSANCFYSQVLAEAS